MFIDEFKDKNYEETCRLIKYGTIYITLNTKHNSISGHD